MVVGMLKPNAFTLLGSVIANPKKESTSSPFGAQLFEQLDDGVKCELFPAESAKIAPEPKSTYPLEPSVAVVKLMNDGLVTAFRKLVALL